MTSLPEYQPSRVEVESELRNGAPDSVHAYLRLLDRYAEVAAKRGDYGIAAAGVLRGHGIELTVFQCNSMFSHADPLGHAECNVLRFVSKLARHPELVSDESSNELRWVYINRDPDASTFEFVLYSTLEPCPMCTVAILNAGVTKVVYALDDEDAGAMSPSHLEKLPPIFREMARRKLVVEQVAHGRPMEEPSYVKRFLSRLSSILTSNRDRLNSALMTNSVLDRSSLEHLLQSVSTSSAD